jgi:uncharacterized SAM-binding protein YcdF (DUF218 family)
MVGFVAFDSFSVPSVDEVRRASAAVVFTGAFERVDAGLQLLDAGTVPRLFISGVNANEGILPDRFVSQFSARNRNIRDLSRLVECCVEWGERAHNTFQNALDTKCWVYDRRLTGSLLLITSRRHMARAHAALSNAFPGRALIPYPVADALPSVDPIRMRTSEYAKFLATIVILRLPWIFDRQRLFGQFTAACPGRL